MKPCMDAFSGQCGFLRCDRIREIERSFRFMSVWGAGPQNSQRLPSSLRKRWMRMRGGDRSNTAPMRAVASPSSGENDWASGKRAWTCARRRGHRFCSGSRRNGAAWRHPGQSTPAGPRDFLHDKPCRIFDSKFPGPGWPGDLFSQTGQSQGLTRLRSFL